jgi:CRISPR-associated endoribonuclease Cas6
MYSLLSLVLTLSPLQQADPEKTLPGWWGRAVHAMLLKTVQIVNPALAESLHDEQGLHPFTASNLMGRFPNHRLDLEEPYRLRLSALNQPLTELLMQAAGPGGALAPGAVIELDFMPFRILNATWSAEEQPWASATTYETLAASRLVSAEPAPRHINLQLTSPTTFRTNGRMEPLPLPGMVFGSLLDRWNSFAPIAFPSEARRYAAECLVVNRFELSSRAAGTKGEGIRLGAVGAVSYITRNYDRYWMSLMHTLAAYALFAGVGAGVSMGMGQCRVVNFQPDGKDSAS